LDPRAIKVDQLQVAACVDQDIAVLQVAVGESFVLHSLDELSPR